MSFGWQYFQREINVFTKPQFVCKAWPSQQISRRSRHSTMANFNQGLLPLALQFASYEMKEHQLSIRVKQGIERKKNRADEWLHTCFTQHSIIMKTIIMIRSVLIRISLTGHKLNILKCKASLSMLVRDISTHFYSPHSDNIPHDNLCPWKPLESFHRSPGKNFRFRRSQSHQKKLLCLVLVIFWIWETL